MSSLRSTPMLSEQCRSLGWHNSLSYTRFIKLIPTMLCGGATTRFASHDLPVHWRGIPAEKNMQ